MTDKASSGCLVVVVPNVEHAPGQFDWPRWRGVVVFASGRCLLELRESGVHTDDLPPGPDRPPGPGVWIWEGTMAWDSGLEDSDLKADGDYRRASVLEAWRILRGDPPAGLQHVEGALG
jgi:hypothetical protein